MHIPRPLDDYERDLQGIEMKIANYLPSTRISFILSLLLSLLFLVLICASVVYQDGDELDKTKILIGILILSGTPFFLSFVIWGFSRGIGKRCSFFESLRFASLIQSVTMVGLLLLLGYEYSGFSINNREILKNTEVWESEDGRSGVVFNKMDPAMSERNVREIIAGVLRSATKDTLLLYPNELRKIIFAELPSFEVIGVSYAYGSVRNYRIILIFGVQNTYMIHSFSERESPLPDPLKYFVIEDDSASEAHEGMDYFLNKPEEEINEIKDRFRQLIEFETGISPVD